ncbi:hypothetical protein BFI52_19720 [Yersinia pestis subsp. microtus]|nr:hypothetical protein BFI52_19720 [Yersinia pestis subsp. microtus]OVY84871.1 hypothetical protein BFI53_20295 [Yersinia pestis subsp. microtus]
MKLLGRASASLIVLFLNANATNITAYNPTSPARKQPFVTANKTINILRHSRRFFICAYKALLPAAP